MRKMVTDRRHPMWSGRARTSAAVDETVLRGGLALLAWLLVSGCASQVKQSGQLGFPAQAGAAVTVMSSNVASGPAAEALGRSLVACVVDAIRGQVPDLRMVPAEHFARVAFPEVPLESAPLGPESLAVLLKDPVFLARAGRSAVRFLITVSGRTVEPSPEGGIVTSGWPMPSVGGFWVWRRESDVFATIYDLEVRSAAGNVGVEVSGRPWFALVGALPLGAPSFTESWACRKLGNGVVEFLRGRREAKP